MITEKTAQQLSELKMKLLPTFKEIIPDASGKNTVLLSKVNKKSGVKCKIIKSNKEIKIQVENNNTIRFFPVSKNNVWKNEKGRWEIYCFEIAEILKKIGVVA
jgi:hypothetical protein